MHRARAIAALLPLLGWMILGLPPASAETPAVSFSATVNGQDVAAASRSNPLRLQPGTSADVVVEATNRTTAPVTVAEVDLNGRVLGLSFFTYVTTVDHTIAAGATDTIRYRLNLIGLGGQATGLIGGQLTLIDAAGKRIAAVPTVTDVRGSLISVYGLFGIALVVLTALAILDAAMAIARHRLSANRWQRGLRLLAPGIGIALVLAFSASVARLWVPNTGHWLVIAGISAAVFFAAGYFSPTPRLEEDEDLDDEDLEDDDSHDVPDSETTPVPASGLGQ